MCGIVGYIGAREAVPILIEGLGRLEYRGYDSAGIACYNPASPSLFILKERGKLSELKARLNGYPNEMCVGIGHTRWATHGEPSRANAPPHVDSASHLALIHNGI